MGVSDAEAIEAAASAASAAVTRGLSERGAPALPLEEVHLLMVLQLARSSEIDEGLQVVYKLFDVLDDAGVVELPREEVLVDREGELQRHLAVLNETPSIKKQRHSLMQLARSLLTKAPVPQLSFASTLTPIQLWRHQYLRDNPAPTRKRKPPPKEPENVWYHLCPDRAPSSVPRQELSKMFKRWMLQNHPDKGGDIDKAARVSSAYSQATGKINAQGANPDETVDEDVVYRQQQQLGEPEWSAYRRAVSERSYCLSDTYLEQRLLKAARWHLARRNRARAFLGEVATLDAASQAGVPGLGGGPGLSIPIPAQPNDWDVTSARDGTPGKDSARTERSTPRSSSPRPAMAFGQRRDAHQPHERRASGGDKGGGDKDAKDSARGTGARDPDSSNNKGFFSNIAGTINTSGRESPSRHRAGSESPKPTLTPHGVYFEHSTAEGEGLTHSYPKQIGRFVIRARDRLFRHVACSPEPFHVVIRGKQIVTPTISPNASDGSITVEYTIAVCGTYKVHVRGGKKGTHVIGSPFTLNVKAAPPSSGQCFAEGAGLRRARAGEPSTFVLHRKDSTGRLIPKGTSRFVVSFAHGEYARGSEQGAKGLADGCFTYKLVDKGDGTFHVNYSTQRAGVYRLHVTLGLATPVEIHGSPFALYIDPGSVSAAQCELTAPLVTPLTRHTKAVSTDGDGAKSTRGAAPEVIQVGKPFYLRLIARDALSNDIELQPLTESKSAAAASGEESDFRAVLTSATGRSLPCSCVRLPCGQLEVCAVAFSAEAHTLHVSYAGAAVRKSPRTLMVQPGPLDLRHLLTTTEAAEAGRISISVAARDVFGNETGAKLICAAVLPAGALSLRPDGLGDRLEALRPHASAQRDSEREGDGDDEPPPRPVASPLRSSAVRAGTHAAQTLIVSSLFGGAESGSSGGGSGGLPAEWRVYLEKREAARQKEAANAERERRSKDGSNQRRRSDGEVNGEHDADEQAGSDDEEEAPEVEQADGAKPKGLIPHGGGSHAWFSARGQAMRNLLQSTGGKVLEPTLHSDGRCTLNLYEITKAGNYQLMLWAEQHSNERANPEAAGANVDDLSSPSDRSARVVFVQSLHVTPGAFSLRHSQVRMPQQTEPPRAGQSFGLGVLAFDKFGNPMRQGGTIRLQVKQLTGPPPSSLPIQPPPMTCQHIDHLNGMHEVRLTTYRAGEHQLVLTAVGAQAGVIGNDARGGGKEKENVHGAPPDDKASSAAAAGGRILRLRVLPSELDASKSALKPLGAEGPGIGVSSPSATAARGSTRSPAAEKARPALQMRAGQWSSALLQCADSFGNPRPAITAIASGITLELTDGLSGDDERATALPASALRSEQRLNADGSIWLRYAPLTAGPRCLSVKLKGVHVHGSPLRLDVSPGTVNPASCVLVGDGSVTCHLKEKAAFRIHAKDAFGNVQVKGGEKFVAIIEPPPSGGGHAVTPSIRDDGDGTYHVEYSLDRVGAWALSVRSLPHSGGEEGTLLPGAPFSLTCLPGSAHLPSCRLVSAQHGTRVLSTVDGADDDEMHPTPGATPHLGHVAACSAKLRVLVRLFDRAGTATRLSTAKQIQLALLPERDPLESNPAEVVNPYGHDARSYDSTLLAWVSSTVKAQRQQEANALTAIAHGRPTAANVLSAGASAVPSIAASGAPALAAAAATGAFDGSSIVTLERASAERTASVLAYAPSAAPAADEPTGGVNGEGVEGEGRGDGGSGEVLYEAHIDLRRARRYRLALIGSSGQSLGPALATMQVVPGRAHGPSCTISGEGLERGYVGTPVDFHVRTHDAAGNALTKGGEKVSVHVKSPGQNADTQLAVKVRDERDGGYALKFVPVNSGMHLVTVKIGRETIGTPLNVMVYRSFAAASSALKLNLGAPTLSPSATAPSSARGDDVR